MAKEKNVSADELKAAIITAVTAQIDQAVKDGKLTQTQAEQLKSKLDSQIDLNKSWPNGGGFKGQAMALADSGGQRRSRALRSKSNWRGILT